MVLRDMVATGERGCGNMGAAEGGCKGVGLLF